MGRLTAGVAEALRATFRRETLPPPVSAPAPGAPPPARSGLAALLAPEPLPPDLPPADRRPGRLLAWLLAPEPLEPPTDP